MQPYLTHMRARNLRPSTIYQRQRVLIRFRRFTGVDPLDATRDDIERWITRPGLVPQSRASELAHFRAFYKWAVGAGVLDHDPTLLVTRPKLPRALPRPMSAAALHDALENGPDRVRLAVTLAAYAGLRACEIAQLRGEHYDLDADLPVLRIVESKGGGESTVPMHPRVVDELRLWPARGPIFPFTGATRPGENVAATVVCQAVNGWLHRHGHRDTLHRARHWFGSGVYRTTGRDLRAAQELLRHRSVTSTQIYTWVDPGPLTGAVAALPDAA